MSCVNIRGCYIGGRCAIIYYNTLYCAYCAVEEGFVYDTHR